MTESIVEEAGGQYFREAAGPVDWEVKSRRGGFGAVWGDMLGTMLCVEMFTSIEDFARGCVAGLACMFYESRRRFLLASVITVHLLLYRTMGCCCVSAA